MTATGRPGRSDVGSAGSGWSAAELRRRWLRACVLGELIGFVPPAVVGAGLAAMRAPDAVLVPGLTAAGLAEGAVLGAFQGRVLDGLGIGLDRVAWRRATMLAAGFAWFAGMGGAAVAGAVGHPWVLVPLVPLWTAALLSMGYLQWRVLRRTVGRSGRWVPVTAGAWLLGVAIPVVSVSSVPNSWPVVAHAGAAVLSAVAMGLVVGALTGRTLVSLVARRADR